MPKAHDLDDSHRFCVAPMLDWTDRHCRYFLRLLSKKTFLYSEMVTTGALLHGDAARHLAFSSEEHPLALQLGGSDPADLAICAKMAEDLGYDEVNLNIGCPSPRVQNGRFGACLMAEPELVAECVAAMQKAVDIPITVKTRLGIDELDSDEHLAYFIQTVAEAGCELFIIHARKAWLSGLSPKENREIPPLCYDRAKRVADNFPQIKIILNGGISTLSQARGHLQDGFSGVMLGRAIMHHPALLLRVDEEIYGMRENALKTEHEALAAYLPYVASEQAKGVPLPVLIKPLLGLFQGMPGARSYRRYLSETCRLKGADVNTVKMAVKQIRV